MEQIVKAAEDLKAAADVLIEAASDVSVTPPDPEKMNDEQKRQWRQFVNAIAETEFSQRLTSIREDVDEIKSNLETLVEEAVNEAKSDMGNWDELDPSEVQEAVDFANATPDAGDIEDAIEKTSEIEDKVEGIESVGDLDSALDGLRTELQPLLEMIQTIRSAARPKPLGVTAS